MLTQVTRSGSASDAGELRKLRDQARLTQAAAAKIVGVHQTTYKRLERTGQGRTFDRAIAALAQAARERDPNATPRSAVDQFISSVGMSPSDNVRELLAQIDALPSDEERWKAVERWARLVVSVSLRATRATESTD
jgi:DNA-binding XRE family transcriptional regulator